MTAKVAKRPVAFPSRVGVLATIPLVIMVVAALVDWDNMNLGPYLVEWGWAIVWGAVYAMSFVLSAWFCIVGFRARLPWIWIWPVLFLFFVPFANIVFWALYRKR